MKYKTIFLDADSLPFPAFIKTKAGEAVAAASIDGEAMLEAGEYIASGIGKMDKPFIVPSDTTVRLDRNELFAPEIEITGYIEKKEKELPVILILIVLIIIMLN